MHIHLCIHGMAGDASRDVASLAQEISRANRATLVLSPKIENTYSGIDHCATLLLDVLPKEVTHISITGYSLGGLIARYLVGVLYHRGYFDSVQAVQFTTFTTPHVGIPSHPAFYAWLGKRLLGRTGKQLYLMDDWHGTGRPLLEVLAHPESLFIRGLQCFERVEIYANAVNDLTVPYFTGAFESNDPFAGWRDDEIIPTYVSTYEPVLESYEFQKRPKKKWRKPRAFDGPWIEWRWPWSIVLYPFFLIFLLYWLLYIPIYLWWVSRERPAPTAEFLAQLVESLPSVYPAVTTDTFPASPTGVSPLQHSLIQSLNSSLANAKKYNVFRPNVRNSHPHIICLNPRMPEHRVGLGVVRFWADRFEEVAEDS